MVRATKLDLQKMHDVLNKHGAKYDKDRKIIKGSYRRGAIKAAAEAIGKDRRTIYNYLQEHPRRPEREPRKKPITPRYVEEFHESETVKKFIEAREGTVADKTFKEYMRIGMLAWKILNKKDPLSWTEDDYLLLWKHPTFRIEETGKISPKKATALKAWMDHCKRYDLTKARAFRFVEKREKGKYLSSWLKSKEELEDVINYIQYPDTLMLFNIGIQCGGRFSSLKLITPSRIEYHTNTIYMKEPKVKEPVKRIFITETLENLQKYISDIDFKQNQKIFPRKLDDINEDLKQAGEKANIPFSLTTHKAMKHTYVSLASNSGIPLDIVALYTGTDPKTLMDFYAGIGEARIKALVLGTERKFEPFYDVMRDIQRMISKRYEEIKHKLIAIDGLTKDGRRKITKTTEKKKPRPTNWKAIQAMLDSEKTPEHLKKAWRARMKLHKQGLSDDEIRKRMKKNA